MKKVCLVHDWLINFAGAEKVLEQIYKLYPSKIYTLCNNDKAFKEASFYLEEIETSFLQKCPKIISKHAYYSPFFPMAIEQFDLSSYDVVLSSSHCVAKGIIPSPEQLHICYCHSPMRYVWDLYHQYLEEFGFLKKTLLRVFFHKLRMWDVISSSRVDHFIANSAFIAKRIKKAYGKDSTVIYPPVDTSSFLLNKKKEEFYLTASRLVSYKGIEKIVEAFSQIPDRKLLVIGDGPKMKTIKKLATKNIEILGRISQEDLISYLQKAKAFLFNAIEDFGILPVEAQATGTPVIALNKGGVKETVIENKTGVFFDTPTVKDIINAIQKFEKMDFDPEQIRNNALRFSQERFQKEYQAFVDKKIKEHFS